jgi:serine/threonine-protein kinase
LATPALPARLGKYELQEFLGGGMSHVYRALDTVIGKTVAIKILTDAACQDEEAKARFFAEARMAAKLEHENVLSIFDYGEDGFHRPFMVMEFLRGEDLRHLIDNQRTGDLPGRLKIALDIARGLEYIHEQKIIHRDIKPENVWITTAGVAKLMDFGIAKSEGLNMTRAGYVLGTPRYMAPEQVVGSGVTQQVDIYSFGMLLFELLTGAKPMAGQTIERIFYAILNEPLNLESLRQGGCPEPVCQLVVRCTAKNPVERPQGIGSVVAELERCLAGLGASRQMEPPARKPPVYRWLIPAVLIGAALGGTGLYFLTRPTRPELAKTISTPTGVMVLVPSGGFLVGEKKEPGSLPPFYIDRTEVTNNHYAAFAKATNRSLPLEFPQDRPDYPAVNVTILEAHDFAKWAGKRLPAAAEWEKAARGTGGRSYPWGADADPSRANVGSESLQPATAFERGASPFGALQMVGNAWEFVEELSTPGPKAMEYFRKNLIPPPGPDEPWYVIRGQSFLPPNGSISPNVIWDHTTVPARWKKGDIGFRCVKDAR